MTYKIKLSPYHKTFYYEWKLNQNRTDYHIVLDQELNGNLNIEQLEKGLVQFVNHHVLFNSHIIMENNELYWVKNNNISKLLYIENELLTYDYHNYIKEPIDLENGPLYRFLLFKTGLNQFRFILIGNHILLDALSTIDIYNKLSFYYNNNSEELFTNLSIINSINDLSENLHQYINQHSKNFKSFWKTKLENCEILSLDFLNISSHFEENIINDNSIQSKFGISEIYFELNKEQIQIISNIKRKYKITPYLFSKIIYAVTLYKYTQQNNFCICYPISIKEGIDLQFGAHVNLNLLPFSIHENLTFEELMNQSILFIKQLKQNNVNYGYIPYYEVNNLMKCKYDNIIFSSSNFQSYSLSFNDIDASVVKNSNIGFSHNIIFQFEADAQKIKFRLDYKHQNVSKYLINLFIQNYMNIYNQTLTYFLEDKKLDMLISRFIFNNAKGNLKLFNHPLSNLNFINKSQNITKLFELQVDKNPNSTALVYNNLQFSYKKINIRANQLANFIKTNIEIGKTHFVAFCLNRSEQMIISILAILKLGKAYCPLDPNFPKERIQYILNDANPDIILVENDTKDIIKNIYPEKQICINSKNILLKIHKQPYHNLNEPINSDNLTYLLYTSGTTGRPKGVMMGQASCVNRILFMIKTNEMTDNDSYLFKTNIIFDVSFSDIFCTLLSGGKLYITKKIFDINEIETLIKENNINICHFVPSQFKIFSNNVNLNHLKSLNKIMISGESIELRHFQRFLNQGKSFYNYYGPTETGEVTVKVFSSPRSDNKLKSNVSYIGKSFDHTNIYVLDKSLQFLPICATGELYLGGICIAEGYLNNSELTNEKFIDNPYQTDIEKNLNINSKLYKTGDLVRLTENGEIEYIGRIDNQIKIRGHRIELSEIENVMLTYPGMNQVAVIAKSLQKETSENDNNKTLICYYVAYNPISIENLNSYLSTKLPDYMVPIFYEKIDQLPLNSSGKLNIKALPEPSFEKNEQYMPSRNELERNLCDVWEKVLSLPSGKIGISDDFFRIGGNSINAIELLHKINKNFDVNISLAEFYIHKNIMKLSELIKNEINSLKGIIKLNNSYAKEKMFMVHPAHSGSEVYIPLAEKLTSLFQCYGIENYNLHHENKIKNISELAALYLRIMDENINNNETIHLLGWSLGGYFCLEMARQLEERGRKQIYIYLLDTFNHGGTQFEMKLDKNQFYEFIKNLNKFKNMNNVIHNEEYLDKVYLNTKIENLLANQKIPNKLNFSRVILFKAKELYSDHIETLENEILLLNIQDNRIAELLNSNSQLNIINAYGTNHISIADAHDLIIQEIKEYDRNPHFKLTLFQQEKEVNEQVSRAT